MIKSIISRMLPGENRDIKRIIARAANSPRYKPAEIKFRDLKLQVTDQLSVAYQLKEYFADERMRFDSSTKEPVIIDCGSNIGVSVIYYKLNFPNAKITAIEPDPGIFKCLENNLRVNGFSGIMLLQKAVWINDQGIEFGSEGADGGSVFYDGNKIKVETIRLKELLEKEERVECLKIDIEGAETDVLTDCDEELKKVRFLFVEYHSWKNKTQNLDRLLSLLSKNNFRYQINSIGDKNYRPFADVLASPMDVQLDIYAINENIK